MLAAWGRCDSPPPKAEWVLYPVLSPQGVFIMNLVDTIKHQLFSDGHLDQLSSLIGAGEGATKSAIGAAVPAVLSALTKMTSSGDGAQKVASALRNFDSGSLGNMAHMLSGQSGSVLEQGSGLL